MSDTSLKIFPEHIRTLIIDGLDKEARRSEAKIEELKKESPQDRRAIDAYKGDVLTAKGLKDRFLREMR